MQIPRIQKRRRLFIAIGLILAICIVVIRPIYRVRSYDIAFAQVQRGQTQQEITRLMGKPESTALPRWTTAYWDDTALSDEVTSQLKSVYRYSSRITPVGFTWAIGFDQSGKVISKHRYN